MALWNIDMTEMEVAVVAVLHTDGYTTKSTLLEIIRCRTWASDLGYCIRAGFNVCFPEK